MVLSALDGRELARCETPSQESRASVLGRRVVTWEKGEDKNTLRLTDARNGQVVWKREFPSSAIFWACSASEGGLLDKEGHFTAVNLATGDSITKAQLDPQPELQDLIVLRNSRQFLVFAVRPNDQKKMGNNIFFAQQQASVIMVFGKCYGVDRTAEKASWSADVQEKLLRIDQPPELPVIAFATQVYQNDGKSARHYETQFCLDKRNGQVLLEEQGNPTGMHYSLVGDPDTSTVEFRTQSKTVKFTFAP